jgi:hypothetical protein
MVNRFKHGYVETSYRRIRNPVIYEPPFSIGVGNTA